MPSIPQSLLWISLVVLWLFVLVPMLTSRRDRVRRTSDVALSTRVLNGASRLVRRGGPATGHRHDPDWQRSDDHFDEVAEAESDDEPAHDGAEPRAALAAPAEQDYLDVDIVEEGPEESPAGDPEDSPVTEPFAGVQESLFDSGQAQAGRAVDHDRDHDTNHDADPDGVYEYIEDTSGLEPEDEPAEDEPVLVPRGSRERRMDSTAAVAVSARKYRFRIRMLTAMSLVMVATAVLALTVSRQLWWTCAAAAAVTVLYLAYLRRQTRIEAQIRRRRQQRLERLRAAAEYAADWRGFDDTGRFQRPGAAVLDIDDEDPIFEHLDEMAYSRHYDLPRAAGQ